MNDSMAVTKQTGQDSGAVSEVSRTGRTPPGWRATHPDVDASPLHTVVAGTLGGVSPAQFMNGIDAANRSLGNRAFMQWVRELQSGGQALRNQGAPLQMMPKKKKKQGYAGAGKAGDTGAGPGEEAVPESVAAQPQAPGPSQEVEPGPGVMSSQAGPLGEAPVGKKKKKSRVQVALNTLRGEGVEAFGAYIEAVIGEAALLRTLVERINRAEDLGGVRAAALARVEARLRLLDPRRVAGVTGAVAPARGQELERAVCAPVKYVLTQREEELIDACVKGETRTFKFLFSLVNFDVNLANNYGTLLINACYGGHENIVKELLARPEIEVNLATPRGATPLYIAAHNGLTKVVELLLDQPGINVNLATLRGVTPLFIACQEGQAEVVQLLLAAPGIDVEAQDPEGVTALYISVQNNFPDIVEQLVRRGADVNLPRSDGATPLYVAAHKRYLKVARTLLQAPGIKVNQAAGGRFIPLKAAARKGHKDIVRLLLRNGADPNIKNDTGSTPLHAACVTGDTAIVEMLLHAGSDMDAGAEDPDREGQTRTPCDLAELKGHREVASVLKAHRRRREAAHRLEVLPKTEEDEGVTGTLPVPGTEVEEETDAATARV